MKKISIKTLFVIALALLTLLSHGCADPYGKGLLSRGYTKLAERGSTASSDRSAAEIYDPVDGEGAPVKGLDETGSAEINAPDNVPSGRTAGGLVLSGFKAPAAIVAEKAYAERITVLRGTDAAALEHGSEYDVSGFSAGEGKTYDFIYEQLGGISEELGRYHFDEAVTRGNIEAGGSDDISGVLLGDKVIDLFYGYGFSVTVNYLDKYTGMPVKASFVSEEIENGEEYDFRSRLYSEVEYGGKTYLYSLGSCENAALLKGTISGDVVIDIYYGYYDSLRINYLSKYDGSAVKDPFATDTVEHLSSYDYRSLLLDEIQKDGRTYLYSLGSCDGEDLLSGTIDGSVEIDVYYGYYNKVTVLFLDKYEYDAGNLLEIRDSFTGDVEHLSPYDFGNVLAENQTVAKDGIKYVFRDGDEDNGYITLGAVRSGELAREKIEEDETVEIVYGYLHSIVINYRDKYTGEIIHREIITYDEKYAAYDKTEDRLGNIEHNEIEYYYSARSGDEEKGTLDADKSIVFNYAYDNSITVCYREKSTGEEIAERATGTQEHFTSYDYTGTTLKLIDGFERIPGTTGDDPAGEMLDSDKQVTVWYLKASQEKSTPPETGDKAYISVPEAVILAASILVILVSAVLLIIKRKNGKADGSGKR